jgi:hypothetical protein
LSCLLDRLLLDGEAHGWIRRSLMKNRFDEKNGFDENALVGKKNLPRAFAAAEWRCFLCGPSLLVV